ncbi:MAG: tRNA (adenosine(37)-N6)-dimethylallyltransferase MiaA [Phycisphaerales bacterium]|nr:tRNA (adenosine(37)-N6)-dimethylallyltransferase MiaA [Phycisphaerales bacterium]
MNADPLYPVLVGPTAGGKTALAVNLAQKLGGEIVTADAYQIYRDLHIGTAKPTLEERQGIPHHLIDLVDLKARFTVHDWLNRANPLVESIRNQGALPIVVGGTNLYIKSFLDGLFETPEPSNQIKSQVEDMSQPERRAMLAQVDPDASNRIDSADLRRTRRALEIYLQTGTPITTLQQQWENEKTSRPEAILIGLDWPNEQINRRINQRVKIMIDEGLVEEAKSIFDANGFGHQSCEAIGYKQLIAHFENRCTLDEAIERIKIDTRRFAKNQRTWMKRLRTRQNCIWIEAVDRDSNDIATEAIERFNAIKSL